MTKKEIIEDLIILAILGLVFFLMWFNKEIAIVEYGEIDVSDEYDDERVMGYFCENHCLGSHLELEVKGNIYENPELLKS